MTTEFLVDDKHQRVTIRTVATHAGVSVAAVSKVMRNAYGVSDNLRAKVEHSILTLGYRPSKTARGLRGRTFTIGLLLVDVANPFLPSVIAGVNAVLAPSNYRAMIGVGEARMQLETSLIESMIDYKMDGLILVAPRLPSTIITEFARQIPIVAIGYHDSDAANFDTINSDDEYGAVLAVDACLARGYRDIGMLSLGVSEGHKVSVVRQREIGYRKAMVKAGLGDHACIVNVPVAPPVREETMRAFLQNPERPRAVFCWSDIDALTLLGLAAEMEIRVPEDLAIVGYDNSPPAAISLINLASIDQGGTQLGKIATQTLLSRIEGRQQPVKFLEQPSFVRRRSIG